ncbi:MAG TPA: hypothetical protein PLC80_14955 [Draconibacterium sp.]|nr:hypothetical protein [Draconibacterium sp.]
MKRPFEIYILGFLILFLSVGAIYGGGSLIVAPNGSLLKMEESWLEKLPFPDFRIPGIILFLFLGIFPLIGLIGLFIRKENRILNSINVYNDKFWGWTYSLYTGIISIVWIISQQLLTAYFILQPLIAGVGLLVVIFALMPRVQKYFAV